MPSEMSNTIDKIKAALGDSQAPWYGSDLVSWVADLLEEHEKLQTKLKTKDDKFNTLANHIVDMSHAIIGWRKKISYDSEDDLIGELERMVDVALKLLPKF